MDTSNYGIAASVVSIYECDFLEEFEAWERRCQDIACWVAGYEWHENRVEYLDLGKG